MTVSFLGVLAIAAASAASPPRGEAGVEEASELLADNHAARSVDVAGQYRFGLRWREPVVRTGRARQVAVTFGRPVVAPATGLVITGTGEGFVVAHRLAGGQRVWRLDHGVPFEGAPVVVRMPGEDDPLRAETVLIGARDGTLLALAAEDGRERWRTTVDGDVRAAPVVAGSRLVLTTAANKVMCLDLVSGKTLWSQGRPTPTGLTVEGHGAPAVDLAGGRVFATFSDGYAGAFGLSDGARLWERPLSLHSEEFVDADADAILAGGRLFVASYSDGIYALDPSDGRTLWVRAAPAVTSLTAADDLLVAASADGFVWGLRQADAALVFRVRTSPGPMSSMTVSRGLIALTAGETGLLVLDAKSGKPVQATTVGALMAGPPAWAGKHLAALSSGGYLYAWALDGPGLVQ